MKRRRENQLIEMSLDKRVSEMKMLHHKASQGAPAASCTPRGD